MFSLFKLNVPRIVGRRYIWGHLNMVFNSVDEDRRQLLGPDRTCAEWVLRNGGQVMWTNSVEYLSDYNSLPPEEEKVQQYVKEINGTDSSISHFGFPHLIGCNYIEKIILHKCSYIDDKAFPLLQPIKSTLKHLQVSECGNVSELGLNSLINLQLKTLVLFDLSNVKNKESVLKTLQHHLPKCNITFK